MRDATSHPTATRRRLPVADAVVLMAPPGLSCAGLPTGLVLPSPPLPIRGRNEAMPDTGPKTIVKITVHERREPRPSEQLYRRHAGWLGKILALRFKASALDVDDLVQETYLRAARYGDVEERGHPRALLLQIAINLARDQLRRRVVRGGLSIPLDEAGEAELGTQAPDQHYQLELKQAVLALPPRFRHVFVLSRFSGLTYDEIASHLGISVKTVEWRMSKALAICAARLRD
ncbi:MULTISPECIES: RNA polymerase sigma factor [unclassified Sphingomonas]|uniref:RNA polymerase sigma factor n=1 Tax=unclassified Sphingomonas TaxID=196159 RepID=UPI0021517CDD|nr:MULTISPECIES: sigma-70 family RNA polymerase sigma factor [unclassified Sphingomonas]MCR5870893.1 sigma-70 family RNA polymerase sigma factor [Sphingomonas sp. J344]UUY00787.1 sigma-70 family RNA polymerase sigma factor [Sphingomonas sp. J315]